MTWPSKLSMIAAAAMVSATAVSASEPIMPQTLPVALDPDDATNVTLGELTYLGGLEIERGEEGIGGISGLEWHGGQLYAVTGDGRWLIFTTDELRGQLIDLIEIEVGDLHDMRGKRLRRKEDIDAESIALPPSGEWLVRFEHDQRTWRYPKLDGAAFQHDGEAARQLTIDPPSPPDQPAGEVTGSDCASNSVCYVLFRGHSPDTGYRAAIVAVGPDGLTETIASWYGQLSIGNFEGLAVREETGRTFLYIVSDNNHLDDQRTLLMKFEVSRRAASAPGLPPKVYETVDVVIETTRGNITVSLETERAPITAANFLRYIDEDRFDGTRCYRAVQVANSEGPNGFLQCGAQNRADRVLPGIAHEPTNETGLSHTDGALSMARFEPGTATGDFSIMIRDQRGLDAMPDAEDSSLRPGFAVFGYVKDGWDTIHSIHADPIDPDEGEGFLKGQMLADPVEIVDVRRMSPAEPPD